jgi:hypothetical protein
MLCRDVQQRKLHLINSDMIAYNLGLSGKEYTGYFDGNPQWFSSASPTGDVELRSDFNPVMPVPDNGFSWEWTGYFKPLSAENQIEDAFVFIMYSDDVGIMWIGEPATSGYTTANQLVSAFGYDQSSPINLRADTYYPVRIQFGHPITPTAVSLLIQANPQSRMANDFVQGNLFHYVSGSDPQQCDAEFDAFTVGSECGEERYRRLWTLGYV